METRLEFLLQALLLQHCSKPTAWDGDILTNRSKNDILFIGSKPTGWDGDEPSGRLLTALGSPLSKPTAWDGDRSKNLVPCFATRTVLSPPCGMATLLLEFPI